MAQPTGGGARCCDGISRRELLRIGSLGAAGLALPQLLRAQPAAGAGNFGRARRVILLFMSGGPPQQDTWDLKPEASGAARGEFRPIRTNVGGIEISEQFPLLARHADKYAIIRSVTHDSNIHTVGAHNMLTGNLYPIPHLVLGRVLLDAVEHEHLDTRRPQDFGRPLGVAGVFQTGVGHQQGARAERPSRVPQLGERPGPEDHPPERLVVKRRQTGWEQG